MSDNKLDISKWKEDYSFLEEFWNMYNEFDKPVEDDKNVHLYGAFCDPLMKKLGENKKEHKNICMKLVRNLGCYPLVGNPYFDPKNDRCMILQYWIYNSVKNQQISNNLITACFDDYKGHMNGIAKTPNCHYHPYEENYNDPKNMIILEIFLSNMNTVKYMLDKENYTINANLQKYICECVQIYKEMYKTYCRNKDEDQMRKLPCSTLNAIKTTYKAFLSNKTYKNYKIPSLDDVENEYKNNCLSSKPELIITAPRDNDGSASPSLSYDRVKQTDELYSQPILNNDKTGNSMSRTVSTTVGTVAGASSIIALLYKFTPGRNWMLSGFRGGRGRISNNLHAEQPNELFYDGFESEVLSSYNPTYNVGYGSV
ncbi:Plasmodium vivax Vir protein, putative [Plasmodium vivax]|uniref:Vir protein, putative n=1 Tax=Plasmodium vivax TaxID=5855 RepID=A0A1G4ECU0_PLAVI|nr:Plasmodium vivax Vir protein, putative [Plasmodium vivax]